MFPIAASAQGPRPKAAAGFSLVEVVIALGLATFALIGILSMFPVALGTAQDAVIETRVALIAQNIFSDLREGAPDQAAVVIGPDAVTDVETLNLASNPRPGPVFVAYTQDGTAQAKITQTQFDQGLADNDAAFLAAIRFDSASPKTQLAQLIRVTVQVVAPASRGATRPGSTTHDFVTWMRDR